MASPVAPADSTAVVPVTSANPVVEMMRAAGVTDAQLAQLFRALMPEFRALDTAEQRVSDLCNRLHGNGVSGDHAWGWAKSIEPFVEQLPWLADHVGRLFAGPLSPGEAKTMALALQDGLAAAHPGAAPVASEQPAAEPEPASVIDVTPAAPATSAPPNVMRGF